MAAVTGPLTTREGASMTRTVLSAASYGANIILGLALGFAATLGVQP